MSEPPPGRAPDPGARLHRYEMRVRTAVAPALARSLARVVEHAVVPPHAVRRLAVIRDEDDGVDLPAVVKRLTECDVAVLEVRLCRPPAPRSGRSP